MPEDQTAKPMTYEQKEKRLDAILSRLDKSETPMDDLAAEAREAAQLITEMQTTLKSTKVELTRVFAELAQGEIAESK